jgi:glycosyltransferase involved in cell wall biosynthesis
MKRVLFVQSSLQMGGAETLLLTLLGSLDRSRVVVQVATLGFHEGPLVSRVRALNIDVFELQVGRFRRIGASLKALWALVQLARSQDVIVSFSVHAHCLARIAAILAGKPTIVMMHTILEQPLEKNEWVARVAVGMGATRVVANSRATAARLTRWFAPGRISCIPNGVDIKRFATASSDRHRWGLPHGVPIVASIGRLQRGKGHGTFIEAAERLRGRAHFVIVGDSQFGREMAYRETLTHAAAAAGVAMLGHIDDLSAFYKACDVVVLASETPEAFGLVLAEAMAAGVSVIGTRSGGPEEVIGDSGLLVAPGNVSQLSEAIGQLLEAPQRRRELGARGAARAMLLYSAESMARSWEEVLEHPRHLPGSRGCC